MPLASTNVWGAAGEVSWLKPWKFRLVRATRACAFAKIKSSLAQRAILWKVRKFLGWARAADWEDCLFGRNVGVV